MQEDFKLAVPVNPFGEAPPLGWELKPTECAWCGETEDLNIHHLVPQHVAPEQAHDIKNQVCLCRECHFAVAHRRNWARSFPELGKVLADYGFRKG